MYAFMYHEGVTAFPGAGSMDNEQGARGRKKGAKKRREH
jgi:hypothetical protein